MVKVSFLSHAPKMWVEKVQFILEWFGKSTQLNVHIFSVVRLMIVVGVAFCFEAGWESTSLLLLVFSLQQQMWFYSLLIYKMATIQMIVCPGIVSGNWKHPTVWPSQQKRGDYAWEQRPYLLYLCSLGS